MMEGLNKSNAMFINIILLVGASILFVISQIYNYKRQKLETIILDKELLKKTWGYSYNRKFIERLINSSSDPEIKIKLQLALKYRSKQILFFFLSAFCMLIMFILGAIRN